MLVVDAGCLFEVALAEVVGGTLLTTDDRLARATGPDCAIEMLPPES